jgi:hypothetical protein
MAKRDRDTCSEQCADALDLAGLRWVHRALTTGRLDPEALRRIASEPAEEGRP